MKAAALLLWFLPAAAGAVETVRISIPTGPGEAVVTAEGLTVGPDMDDASPADFRSVEKGRAAVRLGRGRVVVNGVSFGSSARFRAGASGSEPLRAAGVHVRGEVVVRAAGGALSVINVLPLEDYLVGVLGSEMPRSFPAEALKAQAVAARTYALRKKLEAYGEPHHLGTSVLHQVYGGLRSEDPRTRRAVEDTRGVVLTYGLAPIEAYFHASCGGTTESGVEALNRDLPYLRPVQCPCHRLPKSQWSLRLRPEDLRGLSRSEGVALSVVARSPSGRARRVQIAPGRVMDGVSFRERLGYSRVKSLDFEVKPEGSGGYSLRGRGYGHGAGLCQWGAKMLADEGWDHRRILERYYPGAELQALY